MERIFSFVSNCSCCRASDVAIFFLLRGFPIEKMSGGVFVFCGLVEDTHSNLEGSVIYIFSFVEISREYVSSLRVRC